jgi:NADP-dependent 3-hydroxy acid dehydrogenase YdfG
VASAKPQQGCFAERGAKVVVGARRSERLEKLVAAIQAKNGEARFRTLDVTSREDMKAFMISAKPGSAAWMSP